jgi:hypothetical protein
MSVFSQAEPSTLRYLTIGDDRKHHTFVEAEKPETHFRACRPTSVDTLEYLTITNGDKWCSLLQKDLNRRLKWLQIALNTHHFKLCVLRCICQ